MLSVGSSGVQSSSSIKEVLEHLIFNCTNENEAQAYSIDIMFPLVKCILNILEGGCCQPQDKKRLEVELGEKAEDLVGILEELRGERDKFSEKVTNSRNR